MEVLERPERSEVKDRSQIDVEALASLARERLHASAKVIHRGARKGRVVRRGPRPDSYRRGRQLRPEDGRGPGPPRAEDLRDGVELAHVPVRIGQRTDRTCVVEERRGVLRRRLEPELVRDILDTVPVVVDQDLAPDVVPALAEVPTACRLLSRD